MGMMLQIGIPSSYQYCVTNCLSGRLMRSELEKYGLGVCNK